MSTIPSARTGLARIATLALACFAVSSPLFAQSPPPAATAANKDAQAVPAGKEPAVKDQSGRANAYYHYMLAHEYEEMATTYGRPEYATRAVEEYKMALNADPTSTFLNNGLADLYFRTGRVREAIQAAQDEIGKDPNNLDAHKLLGSIYLRSLGEGQQGAPSDEMLKLAIAEYQRIVQIEPDNIENHLLLGQLYFFSHDSTRAEAQFDAAQKLDPGSEDTALNLARLYTEQGNLPRAIDVLKSLPSDDQTGKTEFALGKSYEQLKDMKNAIEAYKQSVALEPDNLDAERALAKALLNDNQLSAALAAYKDIAAGDPSDPEAYLSISDIERRQGNYEQALATLKQAKALVSDLLEVSYNEGLLEDALGHYDDAARIFEKLVADLTHPSGQYSDSEKNNLSLFLERLAIIYREQNRTDDAIAAYRKMAALGGDYQIHAYESEIEAYRDAHEYDKATQVAEDAAAAMPKHRGVKLMLAGQLTDNGQTDKGIAMAKSLLTNSPADLEVYRALATIYTRLRMWKDASEAIDHVDQLSTTPDDKFTAHFLRGTLLERQKMYDAAEVEFRKALAIDPTNATTLNYLGYMLADHDTKLDDALTMIQKAVELDPQNYAFLDSLGWAYLKLGRYNLAEEDLRKAVERNSTDPTVHDHLGELYEKTGRLKLAAAQWEESLQEYQRTLAADTDPGDQGRVQKKLDRARVRLAKESSSPQPAKP
jgi:tetratricopeptide (TPR) repeat protein